MKIMMTVTYAPPQMRRRWFGTSKQLIRVHRETRCVDPTRATAVALRVMMWPGVKHVAVKAPAGDANDWDYFSKDGVA